MAIIFVVSSVWPIIGIIIGVIVFVFFHAKRVQGITVLLYSIGAFISYIVFGRKFVVLTLVFNLIFADLFVMKITAYDAKYVYSSLFTSFIMIILGAYFFLTIFKTVYCNP